MNALIGADPELFLSQDGHFHSGWNVIPGSKQQPHPVPNGAIQVDGMAVEFNIDPARTEEDFINNINSVLSSLRDAVPSNFHLSIEACATFESKHMEEQPPEAKLLGCEPDFNAYTMDTNPPVDDDTLMRTAAGHIHIGFQSTNDIYGLEHMQKCADLTKQLDYFLGLPALPLDSHIRRQMYGKAGSFRPKSYGVEYRVLSNFWLKRETLMRSVYENTQAALYYFDRGFVLHNKYNSPEDIINTHDLEKADHLYRETGISQLRFWT